MTLVQLGEFIDVKKSGMSARELGSTRLWPTEIARIEDGLGLQRGEVYRRAGFVVDALTPPEQVTSWGRFMDAKTLEILHRIVDPEWEKARREGRA